jgi:hypothetical protein
MNGVIHNDLHPGNIWVIIRDEYTPGAELLEGEGYITCKLYDFDRSYSPKIGDNEKLTEYFCKKASQCNELVESKDAVKLLNFFYNYLDGKVQEDILNLFTPNPDEFREIFSRSILLLDENDESLSPEFYRNKCYGYNRILLNILVMKQKFESLRNMNVLPEREDKKLINEYLENHFFD